MSCALKYLHSINIMHRDVKPNNILLRTEKYAHFAYVLLDFNLSCHFERKENGLFDIHRKSIIYENCGTSFFRAPEVVNEENYSEKIDIFSLGMTAMYLFNVKVIEEYGKNRDNNWLEILEQFSLTDSFKQIIKKMIDPEPTQRPTAQQLEQMLDELKVNPILK